METHKKVIRISIKKIIIAIVIIFLFFLGYLYLTRGYNSHNYNESAIGNDINSKNSITFFDGDESDNSINDAREFMKVSYSATIKTRDTSDIFRNVKNAIRDAGGRVDSENKSEKYSSLRFVIPKKELDNFTDELKDLVHKKLFSENTSSYNLLNQKQNIEQRNDTVIQSLEQLQSNLKTLTDKYTQTVRQSQKELAAAQKQLSETQKLISETTNADQLANLYTQESYEQTYKNQIKQRISSEKAEYINQKNVLDQAINNSKGELKNVAEQDQKFTDNIETVEGSVNIQWVNLWELAKIFSPIHPIIIIVIFILIIWHILARRNYIPTLTIGW